MIRKFRTPTAPRVEFVQYHQPPLDSGTYRVDLTQTLATGDGGKIPSPASWERSLTFVVSGARFSALAPQDVAGVFPPEGSLGDHANVLPHITLKRSTLPWERSPDQHDLELPWLALVVLRDSDFASPADKPVERVLTLRELASAPGAKFPAFDADPGQDLEETATVVEVKKRLLAAVLPGKSELGQLAHVRQLKDLDGQPLPGTSTYATVIANRLPQKGGASTAYLVSVEGRYLKDSEAFDFQGAGEDECIRLVSLKRWRFSCLDPEQSFTALLSRVDHTPGTLRLPAGGEDTEAAPALARGSVPLPHALRQGDKTVSWYHGPLSPGDVRDTAKLPALAADELLRYEERTGMFDVSYAAAWELGRGLTLRNQTAALAVYQWNRAEGLVQKQQAQALRSLRSSRMPFWGLRKQSQKPKAVEDWLADLSILRGVPFEYLVPDERLLPAESLRFFRLDRCWIDCLVDGASSLGRFSEGDRQRAMRRLATRAQEGQTACTGFLLRSSVVSGWPELIVDGYDVVIEDNGFHPPTDRLYLSRMERLSSNVLLCLFDGDVKTVDLHLPPEAMHFGVDAPSGETPGYHKTPRDKQTGEEILEKRFLVPWKDEPRGVLDVQELAQRLHTVQSRTATTTSASFALQMIEGVQKVRFSQQS